MGSVGKFGNSLDTDIGKITNLAANINKISGFDLVSGWATVASLNLGRYQHAGSGNSTDALVFGGNITTGRTRSTVLVVLQVLQQVICRSLTVQHGLLLLI